jgi:hypothetical protein
MFRCSEIRDLHALLVSAMPELPQYADTLRHGLSALALLDKLVGDDLERIAAMTAVTPIMLGVVDGF